MLKKHLTKILVFLINIGIAILGVAVIKNQEDENNSQKPASVIPPADSQEKDKSYYQEDEDDDDNKPTPEPVAPSAVAPAPAPAPVISNQTAPVTPAPVVKKPSAKSKSS